MKESCSVYIVKFTNIWDSESDILAIFYEEDTSNKFAQDYLIWYFETDSEKVYFSDEEDGYIFEEQDHLVITVEESRVHSSDDVPNLVMFK